MKFVTEEAAGGIVYKKEGGKTLYLIVQPLSKTWWGFPKGRVGDKVRNETKEVAAVREVKEETGITAKIVNQKPAETHYMFRLHQYLVKKTAYYFLMEYISGEVQRQEAEIAEVRWVTREELEKTVTYKSDLESFQKLTSS
jgi:8-oxo-dGTP pyrophosphatase MutT (NUDIX family)